MNYVELWDLVIEGERVSCDQLQPGEFVDYQFAGLRLNLPNGSVRPYVATGDAMQADWYIVGNDPVLALTEHPRASEGCKENRQVKDEWGQLLPSRDKWGRIIQ